MTSTPTVSTTKLSFITPGILRKGDSGQDVEFLQQLLNNALYPNLKDENERLVIDGIFGDKTEQKVRIFQGLGNDGIVRSATWRALGVYANVLP
jgi:peptidoglycan hydrolase-like protein with peptidoglycan-binding domain